MSADKAIYTILSGNATITALTGERIYPLWLPQGEPLPAVTFQEIAGVDDMTTDGPLGLVDGRYQINCWAGTHAPCGQLFEAVRALFAANISGSYGGLTLQGTRVLNRGDIPALSDEAETLTRFGKFVDVEICYEE